MNMFKAVKEKTLESYLANVPKEHQELMLFLHNFIKKSVPKLKPYFAHNMVGYGSFPYLNYKKEKIQWPIIALANQKKYISLFVCAVEKGLYVAEAHAKELGNVKVGKSCISVKKLEDLNLPALKKVLQFAAKSPGLKGLGNLRS